MESRRSCREAVTELSEHRVAELDVIETAEEMVLLLDMHERLRRGTREERNESSANLTKCRKKLKAAVSRMHAAK